MAPGRLRHSWCPDTGQTDGVGRTCPSETPRADSIPKKRSPSSYKYCLDSTQRAQGGMGPRACSGVIQTADFGATDLRPELLCCCDRQLCGHWE